MNRNFEQALTLGQALWITSCIHESAVSRLVVAFTHNVDQSRPVRILECGGIQDIEHRWLQRNDNHVEGLLGAHEDVCGEPYRYLLVTDQREIEFTASV